MPICFFRCSKCKSVFDSYEGAAGCESSHLAAVSVKEAEYRLGPYPFRVVLSFPDGVGREYEVVG